MTEHGKKTKINQDRSEAGNTVTEKLSKKKAIASPENKRVHVIIPVYNEVAHIRSLVADVLSSLSIAGYAPTIMLVDDASTDGSKDVAHDLCAGDAPVSYITFSRNFGKEAAIMAGLKEAPDDYSLLAYMDGDGQHSPEDLVKLVQTAEGLDVDIVCGVRTDRKYQTKMMRTLAQLFYKIFDLVGAAQIDPGVGDFNVIKPKVVQALSQLGEEHLFLKGLLAWVGFRKELVPVRIRPRHHGGSKSSKHKMFKLGFGAILSFSSWPLRLWSLVGAFFALLAVIYLSIVVIDTVVNGRDVPGYASTVVLLLGLGGLQLLSIGVVGEYVARIYDATKRRPRYIISDRK